MPRCKKIEKNKTIIEKSSGNVFIDLGYSKAEAINIVARLQLMAQIEDIIIERGLTQLEAAEILGITQSRISELMSSHSEKFTVDKLMKFLDRLDQQVVLTVKPKKKAA